MRRPLIGLATILGILAGVMLPALPAAASDAYSWGSYGPSYVRTRVSVLPSNVPPGAGLYSAPWVIPSPQSTAQSESTPIATGDEIFWFSFTSPTEGALYSSTFNGGEPGPAVELVSFVASGGEEFNSPGDPSISPDGRWLAYAAGDQLFWWEIGDWCAAGSSPSCPSGEGSIQPAPGQHVAYVSSAPTFVADPAPGSGGWAVCSGSANGGFSCYSVESAVPGLGGAWASPPFETNGSPITSSAVVVPPSAAPPSFGGDPAACFGITSFARPRIECVDPLGTAQEAIGKGEIDAPVDSALAYAGGDLWATDQYGGAYAFNAATGALAGRNTSAALTGGGLSIAPPSVDLSTDQVFVVADGYSEICSLQARQGLAFWPGGAAASCFSASQVSGAPGQLTAPTVTHDAQGCAVVWDATDGGVVGASDLCSGQAPVVVDAAPDAGVAGHNFSAVVVGVGPGSQFLVMWSDEAVTYWQDQCGGCLWSNNTLANYTNLPPGGDTGSGLEVWPLAPPLDAWLVGDPITAPPAQGVPSGGECVFAVTSPGASFTGVTYSDVFQHDVPMRIVSGRQTIDPPGLAGCPSPPQGSGDYAALSDEWGTAPQPGLPAEAGGTTAPEAWEGGYEFWEAGGIVAPDGQERLPITVTATTPQGGHISVVVNLYTNCRQGDSTVGAQQTCETPAPAPSGGGGSGGGGSGGSTPGAFGGPNFSGPNCIPPSRWYPGSCVTAWLINPANPPVCGQKPIGGNQWNPHPGCITDSAGVVRDPNAPGGWRILPEKEFTPTCAGLDLGPGCVPGKSTTGSG